MNRADESGRRPGPPAGFVPAPRPVAAPWFPDGVLRWRGRYTGRWWAMVPWPWSARGAVLVEAATEEELAGAVRRVLEGRAN
ncbi:hypothetical protein [Actinomadura fibrosa]|uniref:Uncharacterized protein n=1 Tax=Actinomadura fibrosa TaxID=111802 RepID=A0ABW2XMB3_9ACTN|nr:hypothetical protein [Actinomadura fibrosa]